MFIMFFSFHNSTNRLIRPIVPFAQSLYNLNMCIASILISNVYRMLIKQSGQNFIKNFSTLHTPTFNCILNAKNDKYEDKFCSDSGAEPKSIELHARQQDFKCVALLICCCYDLFHLNCMFHF